MAWFVCILLLIVGFVLLVKGADLFVDGAAGIASKLKVSTFIIGLTIVALGTSAPEAAVSVIGAISKQGDVIMGNVLGSNMMNILLILGISALITKLPVEKNSRFIEIPFLIVMSLLFILLGFLGNDFTWYDGLILLVCYGVFMAYTIMMARREQKIAKESDVAEQLKGEEVEVEEKKSFLKKISSKYESLKDKVWFLIVILIVGPAMVIGGAELVVKSATYIAEDLLHVPASIVALTVVAFGTSLPELVTSVTAARKGDMGLATGNIIGSNIANILLVAGLGFVCSGANAIAFDKSSLIDGFASILAAVLLLVFSFGKKHKLGKAAGFTFLGTLVVYYVYRILSTVNVIPAIPL